MSPQSPQDDTAAPYSSPTAHSSSTTDRRRSRDEAASPDAAPSPDDATSSDGERAPAATRRELVRSLGAGAALLGGASALSGSAAGQEPGVEPDPQVEGIEDWSLTRERVAPSEVQDGPTVSYEDDEVVVTGTHVFGQSGCDTIVAQRVFHDDTEARLGVSVAAVPTYTPEEEPVDCADAEMPLRYELRVLPESVTREVVVEEAFGGDRERSFHPRNDEYQVEPPAEVAEYDLVVGEDAAPDGAESITPTDVESTAPSVTFDGDDVVVEGAMTYGSSSCNEIGLRRIERSYGVEGHVDVELEARHQPTWMPGDPCTGDVAADYYRLELTGSGEPPIDRCSVEEAHLSGRRRVTVEGRDDGLELPGGVLDHRLRIGPEVTSEDGIETDPIVRFEASEGDDAPATVVVEGTKEFVSRACDTLVVGDVSWESDTQSHLLARVDEAQRDGDTPICEPGSTTIEYALELAVEELPTAVTAQEGYDGNDEPDRSVTVTRYGVNDHELPDGVTGYEIALDGGDQNAIEDAPSVTLPESADEPVTIEGTLLEGPCELTVVSDARWDDDAHLAVAVDAVTNEASLEFGDQCPIGAPAMPREYTVELSLESVPDAVTAEEQVEGGEPLRSTTVGDVEDGCQNSTTVDGQTVCDVNGDGYYRDVTGNGEVGQTDVVEFFRVQHREAWKQPELFDFSGNGEVGHGDVVALFEDVATAA